MAISASRLRQDIYRILDQVLLTGIPIEIERKGQKLRIIPAERPGRLERLARRDYLLVDPEEIIENDWASEWRP